MVVPKRHDKLMKHLVAYDKKEGKPEVFSGKESELQALEWDIKNGVKLLPHKLEKYKKLKEELGK